MVLRVNGLVGLVDDGSTFLRPATFTIPIRSERRPTIPMRTSWVSGRTSRSAVAHCSVSKTFAKWVTKSGVANGILDKDFYKFLGTDNFGFGCVVGATAGTTAAELEVCMFVKCKTGDTDFQGCTKGTQATSDIGMKGCCANSPGTVELDYNCTGTTDESGDFYMRVKARVDKCIPYTLSYGL